MHSAVECSYSSSRSERLSERVGGLAGIFQAISPHYAFKFLITHNHQGWVMLGGVLLCVTGTEAMYADLGHFTRISVQVPPIPYMNHSVYPTPALIRQSPQCLRIPHP